VMRKLFTILIVVISTQFSLNLYAEECIKGNCVNGLGTITYDNGDQYVGEWKDDKYHGQGTYTHGPNTKSAGDQYVGEFKNDKRHGQATYTHANGNQYVGEWKADMKHGQGTFP